MSHHAAQEATGAEIGRQASADAITEPSERRIDLLVLENGFGEIGVRMMAHAVGDQRAFARTGAVNRMLTSL